MEDVGRHSLEQPRAAIVAVNPMKRACRKRYERLRAEGPLVPYFGAYFEHLADQGYAQVTFWKKTFLISEFSRWLNKEAISVDRITADHERAFLCDRVMQGVSKTGEGPTLESLTSWLQDQGVLMRDVIDPGETSEVDRVLLDYAAYLKQDRGLLATTIKHYVGLVRRFLTDADGISLLTLRARQITDFFRRNAPKDRTFKDAKSMATALRSFFRFARYQGYVQTDLVSAVPVVAGWSMASIPRALPAEHVRHLLTESRTWRTPTGLRNRAILLLLARLGLRAREIVLLELDDIDWSEGSLCVRGKSREERPLPIPHDVGAALAAYLQQGRPASPCRRFFCARVPACPLRSPEEQQRHLPDRQARAGACRDQDTVQRIASVPSCSRHRHAAPGTFAHRYRPDAPASRCRYRQAIRQG